MNPRQDPVQTPQLPPRGTALCLSAGVGDPRDPDPGDISQHHLGTCKRTLRIQPPRCARGGPDGLAPTQGHKSGGSAGSDLQEQPSSQSATLRIFCRLYMLNTEYR